MLRSPVTGNCGESDSDRPYTCASSTVAGVEKGFEWVRNLRGRPIDAISDVQGPLGLCDLHVRRSCDRPWAITRYFFALSGTECILLIANARAAKTWLYLPLGQQQSARGEERVRPAIELRSWPELQLLDAGDRRAHRSVWSSRVGLAADQPQRSADLRRGRTYRDARTTPSR